MSRTLLCPLFVLFALTGCTAEMQLRKSAALDLTCTEEAEVVEVDENTRTVTACDKKATYVRTCTPDGEGGHTCAFAQRGPVMVRYSVSIDAGALGLQPAADNDDSEKKPAPSSGSSGSAASSSSSDDSDDDDE